MLTDSNICKKLIKIMMVFTLVTVFSFAFNAFNSAKVASAASCDIKTAYVDPSVKKYVSGQNVVKRARKYVNRLRYVYGGTSLKRGCDCSGFVLQILKQSGANYCKYRSTSSMLANKRRIGKYIGTNTRKARAGDIVLYSGHAALATNDGTVINCQTSCGVKEQTHSYMRKYFGRTVAIIRPSKVSYKY
ncbi:MAG: C40 family peptidase [Lachnospiraceae bacterium]|nr:C40 family peptidase [Lachnospiraceae bacterium]